MPSETTTDLVALVDELAARVRELEDKNEIRELTARYNDTFDDMDVEGWVATFTEDAEFILDDAEPIRGSEALAAFQREIGFGKVHATVDHAIDVQGDTATQVCNLVLGSRRPDRAVGSAAIDNTGRYHDELVRTPGGWRFKRRRWIPNALLPE